jgi:signal transduction histidine kinase
MAGMRMPGARSDQRGRRSLRSTIRLFVLALVGLLLLETTATGVASIVVSRAQRELENHLVPAQQWSQQLYRAFVDEETGQRGYLLTGAERFLQPYAAGQRQVASLEPRLRAAVTDARFQSVLAAAVAAGTRWQRQAAAPEIAARRGGPIAPARLLAMASLGKRLFDRLRTRLDAMSDLANALGSAELRVITAAQRAANIVSIAVVALTVLVAVTAPLILRRVLDRPLEQLMDELQAASNDNQHPVAAANAPLELDVIAGAAEQMRAALVRNSAELVDAERRLTLLDERDRLAADLHDHTIQQVFALGLALTNTASRAGPEVRAQLETAIDATDQIIRKLRGIIFEISHEARIREDVQAAARVLIRDASRALGFEPELKISGPVDDVTNPDVGEAAVAVLREMLSNVARHADATKVTVWLSAADGEFSVQVHDNGVGIGSSPATGNGLANLQRRADRFGGQASAVQTEPTGTIATWRVPISRGSDTPS